MTEAQFSALTARVLATPDGKDWLAELDRRSGVELTFHVANWRDRIRRERERWKTGELTP
jgi:hypothetical protein